MPRVNLIAVEIFEASQKTAWPDGRWSKHQQSWLQGALALAFLFPIFSCFALLRFLQWYRLQSDLAFYSFSNVHASSHVRCAWQNQIQEPKPWRQKGTPEEERLRM